MSTIKDMSSTLASQIQGAGLARRSVIERHEELVAKLMIRLTPNSEIQIVNDEADVQVGTTRAHTSLLE